MPVVFKNFGTWNIAGFSVAKLIILESYMQLFDIDLLCLQETWLDESIEDFAITNYYYISRRDREEDPRGGVCISAKSSFRNIVHLRTSIIGKLFDSGYSLPPLHRFSIYKSTNLHLFSPTFIQDI